MSAGPVVLRAAGLSKAWSVPVLREVSLELEAGEVHVLMGSNGAGKSTLAAILGGLIRADAGAMTLGDLPYAPRSRAAAEGAGVVMVLQEMNLFPGMSLAENLFLDRLPARFGLLDLAELDRRAGGGVRTAPVKRMPPYRRATLRLREHYAGQECFRAGN